MSQYDPDTQQLRSVLSVCEPHWSQTFSVREQVAALDEAAADDKDEDEELTARLLLDGEMAEAETELALLDEAREVELALVELAEVEEE